MAMPPRHSVGGRSWPFSPRGEGARRADEGAFVNEQLPPHQFGPMTCGSAIAAPCLGEGESATASHGLTSSPRGERGRQAICATTRAHGALALLRGGERLVEIVDQVL